MKVKTQHGLLLAALVAGLAGGWFLAGGGEWSEEARHHGASSKSGIRSVATGEQSEEGARARAMVQAVTDGGSRDDRVRAAIELANGIPLDEIEAWLAGRLLEGAEPWIARMVTEILLARLFDADPESFLRRGLRESDTDLTHYMALWTSRDPGAAESFLILLETSENLWQLSMALGLVLGESQPDYAISQISKWSERDRQTGYHAGVIYALATHDRELLLERYMEWPDRIRDFAESVLMTTGLTNNFEDGLAWLRERPKGGKLFGQALQGNQEFRAEFRERIADLPPGWIDDAIRESGYALPREDPGWWLTTDFVALGASQANVDGLRRSALRALARPAHRAEALRAAANPELEASLRSQLVRNLLDTWDPEDRGNGATWLAGLGDPVLLAEGQEQLQRPARPGETAREDPAATIQRMGADEDEGSRNEAGNRSLYWTTSELATAREAFAQLPQAERDRVAMTLAQDGGWRHVAPELRGDAMSHLFDEAGAALERTGTTEPKLLRTLCESTSDWATTNPRGAAAWVETLPEGEAYEWASRNLVLTWRRSAPGEAERWVSGLPESAHRDRLEEDLQR